MSYKIVWSGYNCDVEQMIESAVRAESIDEAIWIIKHQRSRTFQFKPLSVRIYSVTPL